MEYYAHSQNRESKWHDLGDHLRRVAELARAFAEPFGGGELGYWAGLWHDLGKFHPDFQAYLKGSARRGPDHKGAGAVCSERYSHLLPFLIAGHHGGLPAKSDLKGWLRERKSQPHVAQSPEFGRRVLSPLEPKVPLLKALPQHLTREAASPLETELFIRLLFSCLVDADFLDTEAHFHPEHTAVRQCSIAMEDLWRRFEKDQEHLTGKRGDPVNRLRHEVYLSCLQASERPQGAFRLTVPTGGGKTRSVMAFALRHALRYGLERVIVAIPHTSIIDQTAKEYRRILGDDVVLEHHSALTLPEGEEEGADGRSWTRLAAENWDVPVVVTTTVQLFESLFSHSPSRCRKLHHIARSVVILDEVQYLPPHLLEPILDVLRQLIRSYNVTIVLCTATQPALDMSPYLHGLDEVEEIVPDPARLFQEVPRVHYEVVLAEPWSWSRVAEEMRGLPQALAVVNTRRDALSLLDALEDPEARHLSTLLCGAHRRVVLEEVKRRLGEGQPCRLISTQVVEAGVDLDFPLVLRALGPLDRIVQAAGRCNREGRLPMGRTVVFDPMEGGLPRGAYRSGTDETRAMLREETLDFHDPATYPAYFRRLYQDVNTDSKNIQALRQELDFPEVDRRFRVIEEQGVPLIVRYPPEAEKMDRLLDALKRGVGDTPRWIWRRLQPYIVNLHERPFSQARAKGLVEEVIPGVNVWRGRYDPVRGLSEGAIDPGDLVF